MTPLQATCDSRSLFKWSLIGLCFFFIDCQGGLGASLQYYLFRARERIV